ncbi:hypothetical protein [Micromonospora parathelypteridis]|uniref:hypothetical protein n=1 Tax=Micromonospora parathelypteridis TaxID=1839617 RepID=UPI00160F31E9|nr:hypothetical protein [Micromonospora parathelypteridis]GGO04447.1 hypothetical protein GCM10011576_06000 [Micromonospora parathelypteridis]
MRTVTRLAAFAVGLAAVFTTTYGIGRVVDRSPVVEGRHDGAATHPAGGSDEAVDRLPGGLLVSDRGYTLDPVDAPAEELAFRITGPDGHPVTRYDVAHDKQMHLIVVRRDLSGFRHVHPDLAPDGTWRVDTPLAGPGQWRAFADFTPTGGEPLTLGVDVTVPGELTERPLPAPATSTTVDGYTVTLTGAPQPGRTSPLTLTISRNGQPVTDLEPYLGAYGHLVALRRGDLAYLHVHPDGTPGDGRTRPGPAVTFLAEVPSAGSYRLYLDFRHGGAVHTAEFTVSTGTPPADAPPTGSNPSGPAPTGDADHGTPGHGHN